MRAIAFVLVDWLVTVARTSGPSSAAAHLGGPCLGATQAGGRALVGLLSPPSRRALFGFWGLAMKLSAILGPLSYGLVIWVTG